MNITKMYFIRGFVGGIGSIVTVHMLQNSIIPGPYYGYLQVGAFFALVGLVATAWLFLTDIGIAIFRTIMERLTSEGE